MSYSRWSYSAWYSFRNADSMDETKDKQSMSLWYSLDKTIDWLYSELIEVTAEDIQRRYDCDVEESQEAMTYINRFIKDVNEDFKEIIK